MRNANIVHRRVVLFATAAGMAAAFLLPGCACRCRMADPAPSTAGTAVTRTVPMSHGSPGVDNAAEESSPCCPQEGRAIPLRKIPKPGDAAAPAKDGTRP